ncbi:MAG TPA: M48 family metallopeptidase [Bryobacteraceae bacterium]|jgi:predicted Zn-dependent protease|nr:M48 family metallopeptidase [Bryobacteraceae bacterium]
MSRKPFYAVLVLMAGCGAAACMGTRDPNVGLESAREIWSDVLRDVDEVGLHATRVPVHEEMELGATLAAQVSSWGTENAKDSEYVTAVAAGLVPHVNRKGMRYQFHVIQSPQVNAFALPGGQVYVLSGLMEFLTSESELAAVLGHEMSHVDLRHCIERYQYEIALKRVGAGDAAGLASLAHGLFAIGYSQDQESDADASGERLAIEAGYDPDAAAAVFDRMKVKFGEQAAPRAETPIGEAGQAVWEALGSYFQSHPPSEQRARQLREMAAKNRSTIGGQVIYRGVRNFEERVPRSGQEFAAERHVY